MFKGKRKRASRGGSRENREHYDEAAWEITVVSFMVFFCFALNEQLWGRRTTECGSLDTDTRKSVVKIVSDDRNNKLVNYAV